MILIFFSRCHVFYPLFHLSGLPFSFFVNNLIFSLLSTFFIPSLRFLSLIAISHHFLAFHCLFLPFLFFSPMSILHFPLFSRFLPFLNSFLSFLLFPPLPSFYTLFLPFFLDRPLFFRSTYVTLPVSFFTFHVSQNVSRETSFFTFFGLRRSMRSDLLPGFPKITLIFHLSYFLNNRIFYSIFDFPVFSTFFLYFCVFHAVFRLCFLSFIKLFNYIFIFSYELNFYIRFFGFSKPFTKRILRPFFQGFLPIWKDFIP